MNKIIFFDIDGTLLDHDKNLPLSTKKAITTLKDKGYKVAIATGRAPFLFKDLREELKIDTYVSFNGQYVVVDGEVIYEQPLDKQELTSMIKFAEKSDHPLVYQSSEDMVSSVEYHPHIEESFDSLKLCHPYCNNEFLEQNEIYQALLFCTEKEEGVYLETFRQFDFVRWHQFSTDVLPVGGSKAKGIQYVIKKLNISEDNVYAFGDGLNDIEMMEYVKHSVAMGNALEPVKEAAEHVTKDVDKDGIFYGLKILGLI